MIFITLFIVLLVWAVAITSDINSKPVHKDYYIN
mgnify:CR=1 FL=1